MRAAIPKLNSNGQDRSSYQIEIMDFVANGSKKNIESKNLIVQAYAGTGKTSTLIDSLNFIGPDKSILITAFNKAIAGELETKAPRRAHVCTMNSLGMTALKKGMRKKKNELGKGLTKLESNKYMTLLDEMIKEEKLVRVKSYKYPIKNLVEAARNNGMVPNDSPYAKKTLIKDTKENWIDLMEKFGVQSHLEIRVVALLKKERPELFRMSQEKLQPFYQEEIGKAQSEVISVARKLLNKGINLTSAIDFTDQLYLTYLFDEAEVGEYDFVFIDEAQDLNPIQHEMIAKCLGNSTRLVAIGDASQCIYQFRGSMNNSMEILKNRFKCEELELPLSYRCPLAVIKEAQILVPGIQPAFSKKGSVKNAGLYYPNMFDDSDMVICRFNAPLVAIAYDLLIQNKNFEFRGRDFVGDLISLIMEMMVHTMDELRKALSVWYQASVEEKTKEDPEADISQIQDRYEAIMAMLDKGNFKSIGALINRLKDLRESTGGILLTTIHQCKGLEANKVFFVNAPSIPSRYAKTKEALDAEKNIAYVGITRAKEELIYIVTDDKFLGDGGPIFTREMFHVGAINHLKENKIYSERDQYISNKEEDNEDYYDIDNSFDIP